MRFRRRQAGTEVHESGVASDGASGTQERDQAQAPSVSAALEPLVEEAMEKGSAHLPPGRSWNVAQDAAPGEIQAGPGGGEV